MKRTKTGEQDGTCDGGQRSCLNSGFPLRRVWPRRSAKKFKIMRARSFLIQHVPAIILAVIASAMSIYLAFTLILRLMDGLGIPYLGGEHETYRGIPNPYGSAAFGLVLIPIIAIFCWWGILSEWRDSKAIAEDETDEKNKPNNKGGDSDAGKAV